MAGHGELPPARVEVYGRNGHAQLDWSQLGDDAFATMVAEFAAAVRGGPSPLLDAAHGLRIRRSSPRPRHSWRISADSRLAS